MKPISTLIYLLLPCVIFAQGSFSNSLLIADQQAVKLSVSSKSTTIPFTLLGGLIMVNTEINGENAACILDTGAPSIIINKSDDLIAQTDGMVEGIYGDLRMKSRVVKRFAMGSLKKKNIEALEVDISYLEKLKAQNIDGILGVSVYEDEEIMINYNERLISLLPKQHRDFYDQKTVSNSISFAMEDQLPVIKVKIGKRFYYFGVDTGAEVNVINKKTLESLKKHRSMSDETQSIAGLGEGSQAAIAAIHLFKIQEQSFQNQEFVVVDLGDFNESLEIKLDGILGYPFLSEQLISLDFRKSKMRFWEDHSTIATHLEQAYNVTRLVDVD